MRKMIVLLLVIGLLVGAFISVAGESEENLSQNTFSFDGEDLGDPLGGLVLCGGGDNDGGGGVPG
ncbi:MAG: hypothetical protein HXS54_16320 [Theionarchaea archaeon]|nr:hypothetical protein [Theionarchaea archaeon]